MKIENFQLNILNRAVKVAALLLIAVFALPIIIFAHGGEDDEAKTTTSNPANAAKVSIVSAERNIKNESGNFNLVLKRSPGDLRVGESGQFLLKISEKVEGGFGGGGAVALEKANVSASVTKADGTKIADISTVKPETEGNYRTAYSFSSAGDYKVVFNVTTEDNRQISADFPVTVSRAPIRSSFWIGMAVLSLLLLGSLGAVFYSAKKKGGMSFKRIVFPIVAALLIFVLGTVALGYFLPPGENRVIAEIPLNATSETETNDLATKTVLTVPKESQLLFGIKTETVATKQITGGLKTTGTVRAKPDAKAVVVPPVAGRIVLREGISLGSAVGRGEQIGTVEQILDVAGQTGLEQQRLDVEAQQRDVEARRLELRNTVLALQGQQADQRAKANQARTQLAQAQRELRRSENLVEVGAVPKKRLEEAQTAVKVAEQEVTAAEKQVGLIENQIKQAQAGQSIFRAPTVRQPNRSFPLTSPITGIVNQINATSGQQVDTATQILTLANLSTVLLEAQVFEKDLPVVRESTRASFTASALSNEVYNIGTADGDGRLVSIGQTVNEQTRTVPVIYEVKNPLNRLRDGMFVEITVDTSGNQTVLAVPKKAVVTEQGQSFVFVFDGGETFEKRPVALGVEGADFYEIKSGLKEGERVVTEGIYQLRSTQPS